MSDPQQVRSDSAGSSGTQLDGATGGWAIAGWYARAVVRVTERPRWAALWLILLSLPALYLTVRMFGDVQASLQELLPRSAPSVRALEAIHARLGGQSHVAVIAESPVPADNRRYITELCRRLEARHIPEAKSIQGSVSVERKWIQDHAPLLIPRDRFDELVGHIEDAVADAKAKANPFFVDLGDDKKAGAPSSQQAWEDVQKQIDEATRKNDRFPLGYLETPDGLIVVAFLALQGSDTDVAPAERLMHAVEEEVERLKREYPPTLTVAYQGEAPGLIEEHAAILADLGMSSVLVFVLVGGLIALYFRSTRGVMTVLFSLAPGLIFTFAAGRLLIGHINSNTAFLGSIIAGNGINYPLLFLAYYRACSPRLSKPQAIFEAAKNALPGTLGAAATASAAYGGLAVSTFRAFSQFGMLGGVGMVTTWIFTYVAMPVAISLFDPPRQADRGTATQDALQRFFSRRRTPPALAFGLLVAVLAIGAVGIKNVSRDGLYEMDLRALRNRESLRTGSGSQEPKMARVFNAWLNPVAALVDDPAHREEAADALRKKLATPPPGSPEGTITPAERVETIAQFVPAPGEQAARLARLKKLATTFAELPRDQIPEKARPLVDEWLAPDRLRAITEADVPIALKRNFAELSGRTDRVVLVFPSMKVNYNDARNIIHFSDELSQVKLPSDGVAGGGFLFMAEIIRVVRDEAPRVALSVCLLVSLVLLPFFWRKPLRIPLVVGTVAIVSLASQAIMFAVGVQLNMINFAAVPITIGVGADYVVNLLGAMDAFHADARRACAKMGAAILLCSLTTVVGYASLLLAQSGALRTFGWAAVLGEVMAVTTVLFILPVLLAGPTPTAAKPR